MTVVHGVQRYSFSVLVLIVGHLLNLPRSLAFYKVSLLFRQANKYKVVQYELHANHGIYWHKNRKLFFCPLGMRAYFNEDMFNGKFNTFRVFYVIIHSLHACPLKKW